MPRPTELKKFERALVINLRKTGLSFRKFRAAIGCHHSTVIRICKRHEKTGSPDKLKRSGRPKQVDFRGERYVCCLAEQHRFSNLKTIINELTFTNLHGSLSMWTVKRILKKYGIRKYARRRKIFVSFQCMNARIR